MPADTKLGNRPRRRFLAVDWQDCAWEPRIEVRRPSPRRRAGARPLLAPSPDIYSLRRNFTFSKTMKTNLPHSRRNRAGFTLVELLTVIFIISVLAGLLLPALAAASKHAKRVKAHLEATDIATAIQSYDSAYGRFPVSPAAQNQAGTISVKNPKGSDFTYGGIFQTPNGSLSVGTSVSGSIMSNAEVIAILMDVTTYPSSGAPTINTNHVMNPQHALSTVARNDQAIQEQLLRRKSDEFHQLLQYLQGRVEVGLKVFWERERLFTSLVAEHSRLRALRDRIAGMSPEESHYDRIQIGQLTEEAVGARRERDADRILEALSPLAVETRVNKTLTDMMVLNAAFLVETAREAAFDAALRDLDAASSGVMSFKYVGPVPPYNFVNISVRWEE